MMLAERIKINGIDVNAHHTTLAIVINDYIAGHVGVHTATRSNLDGNNAIFLIDIDFLFLFGHVISSTS